MTGRELPERECDAFVYHRRGEHGTDLLCGLPEGHEGPHHDVWDHVMWTGGDGKVTVWPEGEVSP